MSTLKVNAIQGTDGVERYMARAWVNFNGTGTVAIRAAGNVSSITDNGTGDYTVNFTNAMPDANYSCVLTGGNGTSLGFVMASDHVTPRSTALVRIYASNNTGSAAADHGTVSVAIFR